MYPRPRAWARRYDRPGAQHGLDPGSREAAGAEDARPAACQTPPQYFTEPRKLEDFCFCMERQYGTQADYPVAWRKAVCTPSSTCQAGPIGPYVTLVASWCNRGGGVFIKSTTEACTEYVAVQANWKTMFRQNISNGQVGANKMLAQVFATSHWPWLQCPTSTRTRPTTRYLYRYPTPPDSVLKVMGSG